MKLLQRAIQNRTSIYKYAIKKLTTKILLHICIISNVATPFTTSTFVHFEN